MRAGGGGGVLDRIVLRSRIATRKAESSECTQSLK